MWNIRRKVSVFFVCTVFMFIGMGSIVLAADDGITGESSVNLGIRPDQHGGTCLDFDDLQAGSSLSLYQGVNFINTDGALDVRSEFPGPVFTSPNSILPANYTSSGNKTRAVFPATVSNVSITMGDYNADEDILTLEAYDSSDNLLGSDTQTIPSSLSGGVDLHVNASNIAYVEFWGRGVNENSVFFDNLCFDGDAACTLGLNLGSTGGTLNMDFTVGTAAPATWNIYLSVFNVVLPLASIPLPAIDPPLAVPIPIPGLPPLGGIGVLTTLTTPGDGIICSDWKTVDTGSP